MKVVTRLQRIHPPTHFLLLGSVIEILYILICTLMPFNTTNTTHWSLSTVWPWVFASAQPPVFTISFQSLKFTDLVFHFLLLSLIIIMLSSAYLYTVGNSFHTSNNLSITTRWLFMPLIGAITFGITLLFLPAFFNIEASSYLFKGLALLTHLINCVLIWGILSHLAPTRRLGGTLLYAWNPLALI